MKINKARQLAKSLKYIDTVLNNGKGLPGYEEESVRQCRDMLFDLLNKKYTLYPDYKLERKK